MEIIISIAAILLIVSLYDFLSTKSWQQVTSSSRNDVVFDERNKNYGAYQIRRNYNKSMAFILLGVVATIGVSYGAYLFTRILPEEDNTTGMADIVIMDEWKLPDVEPLVDIPAKQEEETPDQKLEKQISFNLFEITDNQSDLSMNTQDDVKDIRIGSKDVEDDGEPNFEDPKEKQTGLDKFGSGTGDDDPVIIVDEDAEYPGGYKAMMKFFGENMKYPESAVIIGAEGKANVRFIVEKSGDINDVKVLKGVPNCVECDREAIRVVKMMPKWKPGKLNGRTVRSYYNMPVTFKLR